MWGEVTRLLPSSAGAEVEALGLAAGSRRTVSELVGEPVEPGADAIDLGERRVTAAITGFAQLLSAAGPRPTDVMSSPAANAFS